MCGPVDPAAGIGLLDRVYGGQGVEQVSQRAELYDQDAHGGPLLVDRGDLLRQVEAEIADLLQVPHEVKEYHFALDVGPTGKCLACDLTELVPLAVEVVLHVAGDIEGEGRHLSTEEVAIVFEEVEHMPLECGDFLEARFVEGPGFGSASGKEGNDGLAGIADAFHFVRHAVHGTDAVGLVLADAAGHAVGQEEVDVLLDDIGLALELRDLLLGVLDGFLVFLQGVEFPERHIVNDFTHASEFRSGADQVGFCILGRLSVDKYEPRLVFLELIRDPTACDPGNMVHKADEEDRIQDVECGVESGEVYGQVVRVGRLAGNDKVNHPEEGVYEEDHPADADEVEKQMCPSCAFGMHVHPE
jgi:hypothetical protein